MTFDSEQSGLISNNRIEQDKNATFELPMTIGQYRLEELVGRGGMGDVYRAENLVLKRTEAIKFIRSKLYVKPKAIKRFQKEIESTAQLLHPNIVTVFNAGEFEGRPYMVMEFLKGWTVHQYVRKRLELNFPLSIQEAVDIVIQAAQGLQFAHENGFIHRDVRPGNLWITPNKTVKVLDFGLAVAMSQETDSPIVGAPDFMSPEQSVCCLGKNVSEKNPRKSQSASQSVIDVRSDIYSLGCTLFYILTGQVPFGGEEYSTSEKKMEAQRLQPLPPLSDYRNDVPERIQQILNRMTEKSLDVRYNSMSKVIDAIEQRPKTMHVLLIVVSAILLTELILFILIRAFVIQ